jgi:hypothetical protein
LFGVAVVRCETLETPGRMGSKYGGEGGGKRRRKKTAATRRNPS